MNNVPDWTLRELWLFQQVVDTGTVTAAAARLGMSQSAASRMLAGFETKCGRVLFERAGRSVFPTVAAHALMEQVNAVLDAAMRSGGEPGADTGMILRVGAPPSFAAGLVTEALAVFAASMPQCRVRLEVLSTPQILDGLNDGLLDIGLSDAVVRHPSLSILPFRKASLCCFAAPGTRLAGLKKAGVEDLARETLVFLTRRHLSRIFIERQFQAAGLEARPHFEVSTALSALWLAHHAGAVAMMAPFPMTGYLPVPLVPVLFTPAFHYSAQFVLPARRGASAAVRGFMRVIRQLAARQDDHSEAVESVSGAA